MKNFEDLYVQTKSKKIAIVLFVNIIRNSFVNILSRNQAFIHDMMILFIRDFNKSVRDETAKQMNIFEYIYQFIFYSPIQIADYFIVNHLLICVAGFIIKY